MGQGKALSQQERDLLLNSALKAKELSYSPYSKFRVGCSILTNGGDIIIGCNVENSSYGAGICAERTAFTKAISEGHKPGSFRAISVSSDLLGPCSCCGICRQFIREFCSLSIPIFMVSSDWKPLDGPSPSSDSDSKSTREGSEGEPKPVDLEEKGVTIRTLGQLLPMSFGPDDLGRERG